MLAASTECASKGATRISTRPQSSQSKHKTTYSSWNLVLSSSYCPSCFGHPLWEATSLFIHANLTLLFQHPKFARRLIRRLASLSIQTGVLVHSCLCRFSRPKPCKPGNLENLTKRRLVNRKLFGCLQFVVVQIWTVIYSYPRGCLTYLGLCDEFDWEKGYSNARIHYDVSLLLSFCLIEPWIYTLFSLWFYSTCSN